MTENKTKLIMEEIKDLDDTMYAYSESYMDALDVAIKALEEIQEYRKIGTVEECREAVEKQKALEPDVEEELYGENKYFCPVCRKQQKNSLKNYAKGCHCERCGQKLAPFK